MALKMKLILLFVTRLEERTLDQLDQIRIETNQGSVPISNFVNRIPKPAVGTINRIDQNRVFNCEGKCETRGEYQQKKLLVLKAMDD